MAALPGVQVHASEPDPRNHLPQLPNVTVHRAAISDHEGTGALIQSLEGWGQEWTYSSSLLAPKIHLRRYPVSFGGTIDVELVTLDGFCHRHGIGPIDLVWADVQSAEGHTCHVPDYRVLQLGHEEVLFENTRCPTP
jgi:FkbM family methyltransferase